MRQLKRPIPVVLAVFLALLALQAVPAAAQTPAAQETQDTMSLPDGLRTARTALSAAYAKMDGLAVVAHFAEGGAVDFGGQVISGKQAVGGWFTEMFSTLAGLTSGAPTFVVTDGEVKERSGYTVHLPDGSQQGGSSETVWKKQADGSWKVARLIVM
jgi:ketosteroid isomerase-like protein